MLNTILGFALILTSASAIAFFQLSRDRKRQRNEAREQAEKALREAAQSVKMFADSARINGMEANELLVEASAVLSIESDIWKMPLPYGRWQEFPDSDAKAVPSIRGFWLDCKSRLIGVKMPIGSKYDWHEHPWPETLIGVSGVVTVIVDYGATKEVKKLRANSIIYIPESVKHCVMEAEEDSDFVCVWGVPEK